MYRFLEGILVPKTSKVSPQTPKVFGGAQNTLKLTSNDSKWPQKAPKLRQKGSKVGPNGPKMQKPTLKPPQKALHPPYNSIRCLLQAFPRHEYPWAPFGDLPKPRSALRGHSFTLGVALKALEKPKQGPFLALPRLQLS